MAENTKLDAILLLGMFVLAIWIVSQFGQLDGRTSEANIANTYLGLSIMALLVLVASLRNTLFFRFIGVNLEVKKAVPYILAGVAAGFVITAQGKAILGFALSKIIIGPGAIDPTLGFAFVNILAPFVEEYFFRGALYPSLKFYFSQRQNPLIGTVLAAVIVSALFAVFHLVASGGNDSILAGEIIFSLLQIGLLEITKSMAPLLGLHFMRNLLTSIIPAT